MEVVVTLRVVVEVAEQGMAHPGSLVLESVEFLIVTRAVPIPGWQINSVTRHAMSSLVDLMLVTVGKVCKIHN